MKLANIINKIKSLFTKSAPEVKAPVVEVKPAAKKTAKKATKKVTK